MIPGHGHDGRCGAIEPGSFHGCPLDAFAGFGGMADADTVEAPLRRQVDQPISTLAKWLEQHCVVCVPWNGRTWLALFQFDRAGMTLRREIPAVLAELTGVFDDSEIAHWFCRASPWLDGARPIEVVFDRAAAVRDAARADCFVIRG